MAVQLTTEKVFSSKRFHNQTPPAPPPPAQENTTPSQSSTGEPSWPRQSPNRRRHLLGKGVGLVRRTCTPRKKTTSSLQVICTACGFCNSAFESHPSLSPSNTRTHTAYTHTNPAHPSLVLLGAALHMTWGQHCHGLFWKDKYSEAHHLMLPLPWMYRHLSQVTILPACCYLQNTGQNSTLLCLMHSKRPPLRTPDKRSC